MSVLLEFAMFPTDKGTSVSQYVSKIIKMIDQSGVSYQLTPMGTIIETQTLEEALNYMSKSYKILSPFSERVYATATMDIRKGKNERLVGKIESIRAKIGDINTYD